MSGYPKPVGPSRREVLDTITNSEKFRNPFRLSNDIKEGWPKPGKDRERALATQVGHMAEKGKPIT